MRYRVKPKPEVDAIQWTGENLNEIKAFVGERKVQQGRCDRSVLHVQTYLGFQLVDRMDFIVRHSTGRVTVKEARSFTKTYEPV